MIADILLTFGVISIIGIQALMISIYHERFNKINRQLAALMKHKAENIDKTGDTAREHHKKNVKNKPTPITNAINNQDKIIDRRKKNEATHRQNHEKISQNRSQNQEETSYPRV